MIKTLLSAAFLALLLTGSAFAQDAGIRDTSVPPEEQADGGGAGYTSGTGMANGQASSVFLRGGPINLRANAYVDHSLDQPQPDPAASSVYKEPAKTSASAYNAGLIQARAAQQQQTRSVIPSPFPAGWGQ